MTRRNELPALPQLVWSVAFVALGVALAAAAAWPIYQSPRVILIAVVGGGVGMGIALLSAWRGWSALVSLAAAIAAYAILVVPLAIPAALVSPMRILVGIRDGFAGVVLGWKQLVTIDPPLGQYQAVLVPLLLIVFIGSCAALRLALRPGSVATAAVPVVIAMTAFGIAFGLSELGAPVRLLWWDVPGGALVLLATGVVVLSLVWLVGRSRIARAEALARARGASVGVRQMREATWPAVRRNALGAGILIVALAVGAALAPVAAGANSRTTLRDGTDPYLDLSRVQSPLTTYRGWFAGDALDAELFTVSGGGDTLDRIRLATLTEFDGSRFELGGPTSVTFSRLANTQPADSESTVDITIGDGYSGPWLPLPGIVSSAPSFGGSRGELLTDGLFVAPGGTSAVVVDRAAAKSGVVTGTLVSGDSFTVAGAPVPTSGVLEGEQGGEPMLDDETHEKLATWVDRQELPRTGDGLLEAIDRLRARGFLSHSRADDAAAEGWIESLSSRADYTFEPSLAGHSTSRLEALFTSLIDQEVKAGEDPADELLVSGVGDDEQFAPAAALLARYFGFDSRVVLGVVLRAEDALPPVLPCSADGVCTGANVTAWAEVQAPDGQWMRVDASPQFAEPLSRVVVGEILPEHPTVPDEVSSEVLAPPNSIRADSEEPSSNEGGDTVAEDVLVILRWVGLGLLVVLLLTLPVLVLAGAKILQARRRRAESVPEASIVGAWEELVDRYVDAGILEAPTGTRRQIAESAGRPAAVQVATAVDVAVFDSAASSPEAAAAVWDLVAAERSEIARSVPLRKRLAAALSVASFVRHIRQAGPRRRGSAAGTLAE